MLHDYRRSLLRHRGFPVPRAQRAPSEFSRTFGALPSMTATQEFVVPRSMPTMALLRSAAEAVTKPRREACGGRRPPAAAPKALDIDMAGEKWAARTAGGGRRAPVL